MKWSAVALVGMSVGPVYAQQAQTQPQMMMPQGCANLTPAEKTFAGRLNPSNQMIFCTKFNLDQRQKAMQKSGQRDESGNVYTPDTATEKVASDFRITPSLPRGGCPVK